MKKILIKTILVLSIFSLLGINNVGNTYALEEKKGITVIVTENIPGAGCEKVDNFDPKNPRYICKIKKGFASVTGMMGKMIKYFTYIALLGGVLFIVVNGMLYSMGGAEPSMKDDAKKRIIGTLVGLLLLFLSGVVLNLIAPWIYK